MGSVETKGPDSVGEHSHPMLDQLFLGLEGCKCTCYADGEEVGLTENMLLHIPLGSRHSVSVEDGDTLSYIWLDFFLTLNGEKYMNEQHHIESKQNN
jgi:quercetin dioxygenase-like cupin family protein